MAGNGFWMFLTDVKNREEKNGHRFRDRAEIHTLASREWLALDKEKKLNYKERARTFKQSKTYYDMKLARQKMRKRRRKTFQAGNWLKTKWDVSSDDEDEESFEEFCDFVNLYT